MATSESQHQPGLPKRPLTRLQRWLDANGFTSAQLEAVTAIPRQSMTKIRAKANQTRKTMIRIRIGASKLAGRPVPIEELFDFESEESD